MPGSACQDLPAVIDEMQIHRIVSGSRVPTADRFGNLAVRGDRFFQQAGIRHINEHLDRFLQDREKLRDYQIFTAARDTGMEFNVLLQVRLSRADRLFRLCTELLQLLDLSRRRKLLSQIEDVQTILTCTHTEKVLFGKTVNKIRIVAGKIKR